MVIRTTTTFTAIMLPGPLNLLLISRFLTSVRHPTTTSLCSIIWQVGSRRNIPSESSSASTYTHTVIPVIHLSDVHSVTCVPQSILSNLGKDLSSLNVSWMVNPPRFLDNHTWMSANFQTFHILLPHSKCHLTWKMVRIVRSLYFYFFV